MEEAFLEPCTYTVVLADPAQNRTALVLDAVAPQARPHVARALMALPLNIEQVGFVCPVQSNAWGRLEICLLYTSRCV